ncbi:hypothetical protein ACMD2_13330 [Ananas comosus]|uniref:Uncharacterized protein n=1 Tax=Ananas comosus TaxID=4615 RepID=A0A199UE58_ANACO|nr:hypothetical protein ACMD2_13330 [Ananas comosus]
MCGVRLGDEDTKSFKEFLNGSVWNVRGLNEPSKRRAVKCVVSSFTNAVLCLQETKVGVVSLFSSCYYIGANGASSGLLTCWSSRVFSCSEVIKKNFSHAPTFSSSGRRKLLCH